MSREEQGQTGGIAAIIDALAELPDPRQVSLCDYPLNKMLLVALCGVISGAQGWVDVVYWGNTKQQWLRQFLRVGRDSCEFTPKMT